MTWCNLREYLDALKRNGDLVEIEVPVDARLEIPEIHRRTIAAGGPALLFRNVRGSPFGCVTNLFGSARRIELAFGPRPKKFLRSLAKLAETILPPTPGKLWDARQLLLDGLRVGLSQRGTGPVLERAVSPPDLRKLPATTSWVRDGGPFLTLGLVYTELPGGGKPNLGLYRMQVFDAATTGIHWQIGKGGGFHYAAAEKLGEALPLTVHLGGPPGLILAAAAPLPEGVPETLLASLILGHRLPVTRVAAHPHPLVAEAEFALAGEVPPVVRQPEGPFGDHYGYYSLKHDYPVFQCKTLYHRRDAILPATVVGKPHQEDFYLGDYLQELLSPLFPLVMPTVRDLWAYGETGYHPLAAAVIQERYGREAMVSAFRILGEGQLSLTKFLVCIDTPLDLKDFRKLLVHVLERVHWETDLYVFSELSMDTLDYAGPEVNKGSKGVLLGLGQAWQRLPEVFEGPPPAGAEEAIPYCPGCLIVQGPGFEADRDYPARLAADLAVAAWPLVVLSDRARHAAASTMNFLWTTFTRFEPAADLHSAATRVVRHHLSYSGPIVIDARMKPWYPEELFCDPETRAVVDRRWNEYFPDRKVEMGGSDRASLTGERA
ncbi:MAG: UbiD family decarboxylase [Candidatus Wallbacteria bacterium]|nr:UbiD family decarboxylase [Candidatus Wallbacteria bacterium]